ncbi:hypothetical protein EDB85DRAFT_543216 [Lactarius pseudohatsudake]|nr:hypothetical protein EDB85DRAFT_543216 [Lactarius pseudohatsudake]
MSYTLYRSLTHIPEPHFPATESIKQLIETIGRDVVRFRRNTQISYNFVDKTRSSCQAINSLIREVDENDDWDSYDKFTEAVDLLEELLLNSATVTQDEVQRHFGGDKDVETCIASASIWEANRERLRNSLNSVRAKSEIGKLLHNSDEETESAEAGSHDTEEETEIVEAGKHDDASFLLELYQSIKSHSFRERAEGPVPQLIELVNDRLADLYTLAQSEVLDDVLAIFTIKAAMLVSGVMDISVDSRANKDRTHHLKRESVWDAIHKLLNYLYDITEGAHESVPSVPEIEEKFDAFLQILQTIPEAPLPAAYTQLMKQAGKIRRPYHAQALALISLCRFLARHYEGLTEAEHTATNIEPFEDTCRETLSALQVAVASESALRGFDFDAPENAHVVNAFAAARTTIRNCFEHFGMTSHWAHYERIFLQAVEKDRSRTVQLNELLAARPSRTPDDTSDLVRVNVQVRDGSATGNVIREFAVGVEAETRLRALRWHISKALEPQDSARVLRDSTFFVRRGTAQEGDSLEPCRVHMAIEEITRTRVCDLVLVLA